MVAGLVTAKGGGAPAFAKYSLAPPTLAAVIKRTSLIPSLWDGLSETHRLRAKVMVSRAKKHV
jgi:hypothetical protein